MAELSKAIKGGRGQDLNDAFGNLEGFAVDGSTLLKTLDEQEIAVRRLIKNTGVVFGAINEREGALRELVVNSNNTFEATASRDAGAGRDLPRLPDLPGRVQGHAGPARALLAPTRGRWSTCSSPRPTTWGRRCATWATWPRTSRACSAT